MIPVVTAKVQKLLDRQWMWVDQEVEVLTVHFAKGTMRVRWIENDPRTNPIHHGKVQTDNISNEAFLREYSIKRMEN
jgi:hypothetical protein